MAEQNHEEFAQAQLEKIIRRTTELRQENYLSQKQVCEILGLTSHGNLTMIEQGKTIPKVNRLLKILSVYGYTLEIVKK